MRFIRRIIITLVLFINMTVAAQVNVYLKFDEKELIREVNQFNAYLDNHGIFERYKIRPFIEQYPLHITLYLASYPDGRIEQIKKSVAHLAAFSRQAINVQLKGLSVTPGNFVMLDIASSPADNNYIALQRLSNKVTIQLAQWRDPNAAIPPWASNNPGKKKVFQYYGSPNVFSEYSPHFSLMAKNFTDAQTAKAFQDEMKRLIEHYSFPLLTITATSIGIGYVDSFGQVTQEIATFSL